jgi:hypothetical protein
MTENVPQNQANVVQPTVAPAPGGDCVKHYQQISSRLRTDHGSIVTGWNDAGFTIGTFARGCPNNDTRNERACDVHRLRFNRVKAPCVGTRTAGDGFAYGQQDRRWTFSRLLFVVERLPLS